MNKKDPVDSAPGTRESRNLHQIQKMLRAKLFDTAEVAIEKLLLESPSNAESQYTCAVIKRLVRKESAALSALEKLHQIAPDHSRGYQEKGFIWMARKDLGLAIKAFERAVDLDPALISSWKALCGLYKLNQNHLASEEAAERYEELRTFPPELLSISTLITEGRLEIAESRCRDFLQKNPKNVQGIRLLARIGSEVGILDDAEHLLQKALKLKPDFNSARCEYIAVLQKRQKFSLAYAEAEALMKSAPNNYNYRRLYANTCLDMGQNEEAISLFKDLLRIDSNNAQILLMCGHAAKTIGRSGDAIDYYRRSYRANPNFGDAFWSLANLKTYTLSDHEREVAKGSEEALGTSTYDRIHLNFALGKAYEDIDEFERAFQHYKRGNSLKLKQMGYLSKWVSNEFDAQIEVCSEDLFRDRDGCGHSAADPIFIVGLPRAGSTLLEQILASHSRIDGTRELPNILHMVAQLNGRRNAGEPARYPKILRELNNAELEALGKSYIEETRYQRGEAEFFTDKMPNNFRHLGFIKLILPNAKVIDARREPMACCWSSFTQLFAEGQAYTYGLEEVGRYYRDYLRLMDHWETVLPGQILRVQYEDVVNDTEAQVRRVLRFCGLEMEPACLEFYKTERSVNTPSSEQVRLPVYKRGIDQWKKFEAHLQPLKMALDNF